MSVYPSRFKVWRSWPRLWGASEPEGVVEVAVDAFGVVATRVQACAKSGSSAGMGRTFSVRLNFRRVSSLLRGTGR